MDNAYGNIRIGGPLPQDPAVLHELAQLLMDHGTPLATSRRTGWLRPFYWVDENVHLVSGALALERQNADGGRFERLETFCREHAVPYDQHANAGGGFDAMNFHYRPGYALKNRAWFPHEVPTVEFLSADTAPGEDLISRGALLAILSADVSAEVKLARLGGLAETHLPTLPLIAWGDLEAAEDRLAQWLRSKASQPTPALAGTW